MSDLDEDRLREWLQDQPVPIVPISIQRFAGGQSNPTYRLNTSSESCVLRRQPFGEILPSAHAVDREFRLLTALHAYGFPVPQPLVLCDDPAVIGSKFYLMEMVNGRTLWDGTLPGIEQGSRRGFYYSLVDVQAALHLVDHAAVGLTDFGAGGNYLPRQVARWTKQYRAAQTSHIPDVEKLIEWLPKSMPEQSGVSIIHGDFRIDNAIFDLNEPQVIAVIDWELATIGDPLADFAYLATSWLTPFDGRSGLSGVDLRGAGIPTLDDIVERYCNAMNYDRLPDLQWYFAFNFFRLVGIVQGIKKRMADGNASSAKADSVVRMLEPYAALGWEQARMAGAME